MIYLVVALMGAVACGVIAPNKNRNAAGWAVFGFLLPLIALILVLALPALPKSSPRHVATLNTAISTPPID